MRCGDELTAKGVTFERYDDPRMSTDEKGIAAAGGGRVAWLKDPEGDVLAISQM